jgi:hypothetical protein
MYPSEQILQLPIDCMKPGAEDVTAMNNRNLVLGALYELDGRHDPSHPYAHTYTGLYQKFVCKK